jgi:Mor family transcriptional regulator
MEEIEKLKKENQELKKTIEFLQKKIEELSSFHKIRKNSMLNKASKGNLMSRAPFGYYVCNGNLFPNEKSKEVVEIFETFLNEEISLRELAKKHNLSVNGIKKILRNFTYLGKIKFNNQIYEGTHEAIISSVLFNHVQDKLERLGIK